LSCRIKERHSDFDFEYEYDFEYDMDVRPLFEAFLKPSAGQVVADWLAITLPVRYVGHRPPSIPALFLRSMFP
jgi:hypothetical protein